MKLNKNGFSIVEMFAVIFITSLIIFPLITTLVNNIEINDREQRRLAASNIAKGSLDNLNRLSFSEIDNMVQTANGNGDFFIELNYDTCVDFIDTGDEFFCQSVFTTTFNNTTYDSSEFRVFIFNYNLPTDSQTALVNNNNGIPDEVKTIIGGYTTSSNPNPELYNVIIWIEYDVETSRVLTLKGLLSSE